MITTEQKLDALNEARSAYGGIGLDADFYIATLSAIIADLEHLPALVEAANIAREILLDLDSCMVAQVAAEALESALAHFTEAGGQGGEG